MPRKISAVLVLGLLIALPGFGQTPPTPGYQDSPVMPAGAKGERIRTTIETINSGDPDRMRRFVNEVLAPQFRSAIPVEGHVQQMLGLQRGTGGLDFHGIRTYVPERPGVTVVIAKDRNLGNWNALTFRFTEDAGALIAGLGIANAPPPTGIIERPLQESEAVAELKSLAAGLAAKGAFSGAILLAKGETILLTSAGGEASKAFHVPNNIDTKFNLGSMNKMFTSTAIARLVEKGAVGMDDRIDKYIDESWLPKDVTAKITIRHLLTHTSGLGSYFNEAYSRSSRTLFRKLDDYKPLIKDDRPAFEPGARFQYSNTGMFLLGVVIEKATGEDYFDHIRKTIYGPCGMTNSDCYEMDTPIENLAIGYSPDAESPTGWRNNLYTHVLKGGPAGGGFSTVKDLHKFALALLSGKLVSKDLLAMMWTDYKGGNYGYGFQVRRGPLGKSVGHSGGFDGINSQLDIYVGKGYIAAVMSNVDRGASPLAAKIGQLLGRIKAD